MLRALLPVSLLAVSLALPASAGAQTRRGIAPIFDSARTTTDRHHDGRCGRACSCDDRRWHRSPHGAGHVARPEPSERPRGAVSGRTLVNRRHGDACACRPCLDLRRDGHHGGHDDGDTIIIVTPSEPGRAPGVVIRDRDSTRVLLDAVSVEKPRRTDGVLAASESGGDVLVRGANGPVVRGEAQPSVPAPSALRSVRAGGGDLYVHVRADGSLEIRRR